MRIQIFSLLFIIILLSACNSSIIKANNEIRTGADQTEAYLPLLQGKSVGIVANHTSLIQKTHIVDSLLSKGIKITKIFSPEHGFRGNEDAGANIKDGKDIKTGLPIISLHGKTKKPLPEHLKGIEVMLFDIQDVGVRFYTYISTMHYVMEACAENNIPLIILDRPNPNGDYVNGPVLDPKFSSFVGKHPIPVVHGLTVGELAQMINGEKWLNNEVNCKLQIIPCANYTHLTSYDPPVKPSPNLPNLQSIRLYPSLCFFEPTQISIGRGTLQPFQIVGYPGNESGSFSFTPASIPGMSTDPKHKGIECRGEDLSSCSNRNFDLSFLYRYYHSYPDTAAFFTNARFFDLLAGSNQLRTQLIAGKTVDEISTSWKTKLDEYKIKRKKYLLYPDFE